MNTFLAHALIKLNRRSQVKMEKDRMRNGRADLFSDGITCEYDLPYLNDGNPRHTLDIICPDQSGKLPVIIEIHGGGYIACEKNINRLHCRAYAQLGFRVVNADYTLIPEGDFQMMLKELTDIVTWVSDNAERYSFDTERVYMSGDSAGGHLVLLYCMLQGNRKMREYFGISQSSLKIKAAAPTCPAFSFDYHSSSEKNAINYLTKLVFPHGANEDLLNMLDVTKLIPCSEFPPLYITTTPGDNLLYKLDCELEKVLSASGREYCFHSFESHGSNLGHVFNVLFPEYPESVEANRNIAEFFLHHC